MIRKQASINLSVDTTRDNNSEVKAGDNIQPLSPYPQAVSPASPSVFPSNGKKFVIVSTSSLPQDQIKTLECMGKTVLYDEKLYNHVPIANIEFDYLVFKLTKTTELWFIDNVMNTDVYHIIALCKESEAWTQQIHCENCIKKIPDRLASCEKDKFDNRLLNKDCINIPSKSLAAKFKKLFNKCLPIAGDLAAAGASAVAKKF